LLPTHGMHALRSLNFRPLLLSVHCVYFCLLRLSRSPEDQATLEAEYRRDPKPDKAARLEIVKRVSLGEKEVQVGAIM